MSVAPSEAQLEALRAGDPTERIALVRLVRAKDPAAYGRWLEAESAAVKAAGGRRIYRGVVDHVLLGEGVAADELILDEFPSRELAAESLRKANPYAESGLAEAFVLAARPLPLPGLPLRVAGWLARLRAARRPAQTGPLPPESGHRAIEPPVEEFGAFLASEPARPLDVLNLNEHADRAAYGRYGRNTLPHLLSRRAGPIWVGDVLPAVVGPASHPFAAGFHEVLLVRYPTRGAMLDMFRDPSYQRGLPHRHRGLARAGLVAACPLPGGTGHSGSGAARSLTGRPVGEPS